LTKKNWGASREEKLTAFSGQAPYGRRKTSFVGVLGGNAHLKESQNRSSAREGKEGEIHGRLGSQVPGPIEVAQQVQANGSEGDVLISYIGRVQADADHREERRIRCPWPRFYGKRLRLKKGENTNSPTKGKNGKSQWADIVRWRLGSKTTSQ